jgi:hypothetical protein
MNSDKMARVTSGKPTLQSANSCCKGSAKLWKAFLATNLFCTEHKKCTEVHTLCYFTDFLTV